ncbi:hypothetical protein HUK80_09885 [Flavobacterium sp. MAH-1]|uniref:Uncharacterized protein n=1 Tax=Flavobacterium agri TaxID=2743471 RepID=A0A7Y8Y294_9FLAO|nr:hypothetical protein [Flavobacterium agri]NUY81204.1 hypothetical protein [Flavobacterium agri]NYA71228.1 hypothetical protein [Flavobacterium agri]
MENTRDDRKQPINDGDNQGHDWARQQENASVRFQQDKSQDTTEEEEHQLPEWGDIDPLDRPGPAGPMDPSGPGSAV